VFSRKKLIFPKIAHALIYSPVPGVESFGFVDRTQAVYGANKSKKENPLEKGIFVVF
jgi:hypothetical protein